MKDAFQVLAAVGEPAAVTAAVGEPQRFGLHRLLEQTSRVRDWYEAVAARMNDEHRRPQRGNVIDRPNVVQGTARMQRSNRNTQDGKPGPEYWRHVVENVVGQFNGRRKRAVENHGVERGIDLGGGSGQCGCPHADSESDYAARLRRPLAPQVVDGREHIQFFLPSEGDGVAIAVPVATEIKHQHVRLKGIAHGAIGDHVGTIDTETVAYQYRSRGWRRCWDEPASDGKTVGCDKRDIIIIT